MTLNKAIEHGKLKRRPYYKSERFDASCRPHGGCGWCRENRLRYKKYGAMLEREQREWTAEYYDLRFEQSEYLEKPPIFHCKW